MPPFDRRRPVPERTAGGRTAWGRSAPAVFTSDDLDRDLSALMQDPLYWRERDKDFADHVTRQFERVHGSDGPKPDADGKRRGTLEVPRLSRRPGDGRLKQPVGRDAPNRPDDVTRLQRALSETGDYTFTAPRERSGVMSANLDTALTRYQRRTGLQPDGYAAPGGPTIQQIAAAAEVDDTPPLPARKPGSDVTPASPDKRRTIGATREQRVDSAYKGTDADQLIADIKNTEAELENTEHLIDSIKRHIENQRSTLRDAHTELATEGAGAANKENDKSKNDESRRGRGRRLLDNLLRGIDVADSPGDIGTTQTVPGHIQRQQAEIERLQERRDALARELDQLRTRKAREYPRHVPAWD
jgi:hypothetical protein